MSMLVGIRRIAVGLLALGCVALAQAPVKHSLIDEDSLDILKKAAEADSKPKRLAYLKGLLPDRLSISVDLKTIPAGSVGFEQGVKEGAARWNEALGSDVFTWARTGKPTIIVKFVDVIDERPEAQGLAVLNRSYRWSSTSSAAEVDGVISIKRTLQRRLMTKDEVAQVAAHELGHILGLKDVDDDEALMGAITVGESKLWPLDRETAAVLRFRLDIKSRLAAAQR